MLKETIHVLLKRQGKTQKELCNSIGISDTGLRKIFARDSCEIALLKKIANFFNVPMSYFFKDSADYCYSHHTQVNGDGAHGNINSDGSADTALLQERVKALQTLLEEKERTIKILMEK